MGFVGASQESRLMMIEPPRQFWRRRVLEIDNRIFIAVEHVFVEKIAGPVQQTAVVHLSLLIDSFVIKPGEGGRRSDAVKAVTVIKDAKFHFLAVVKNR